MADTANHGSTPPLGASVRRQHTAAHTGIRTRCPLLPHSLLPCPSLPGAQWGSTSTLWLPARQGAKGPPRPQTLCAVGQAKLSLLGCASPDQLLFLVSTRLFLADENVKGSVRRGRPSTQAPPDVTAAVCPPGSEPRMELDKGPVTSCLSGPRTEGFPGIWGHLVLTPRRPRQADGRSLSGHLPPTFSEAQTYGCDLRRQVNWETQTSV